MHDLRGDHCRLWCNLMSCSSTQVTGTCNDLCECVCVCARVCVCVCVLWVCGACGWRVCLCVCVYSREDLEASTDTLEPVMKRKARAPPSLSSDLTAKSTTDTKKHTKTNEIRRDLSSLNENNNNNKRFFFLLFFSISVN